MKTYLSTLANRARLLWWMLSLAAVAALLLAACGGGGTTTTPTPTATSQPTPTPTPTVVMVKIIEQSEKYSFSPATLSIKVGTQVVWTNTSDAPHTVTSDSAGVFSSPGNITQHQTFMFTFTTPGTFAYHCNVHPYMKATITVTS
jgi:plastocyanin